LRTRLSGSRHRTLVETLWLDRGIFDAATCIIGATAILLIIQLFGIAANINNDVGYALQTGINITFSTLLLVIAAAFRMLQAFIIVACFSVGALIFDLVIFYGSYDVRAMLDLVVAMLTEFAVVGIVGAAAARPRDTSFFIILAAAFLVADLMNQYVVFVTHKVVYYTGNTYTPMDFMVPAITSIVDAAGALVIIWVAWRRAAH
jgi:hypothetical protein